MKMAATKYTPSILYIVANDIYPITVHTLSSNIFVSYRHNLIVMFPS